jgi:16S rRNA (guanine(966)-N(2))-methyltransferase RsmD
VILLALKIETGSLRGKSFSPVDDKRTRYTTGQLRMSIMNMFDFSSAVIIDFFGGSGSFSFEAISNGAKRSYIVDISKKAVSTIIKNAKTIGIDDRISIFNTDYSRAMEKFSSESITADVIFADPPFNMGFCSEFLLHMDSNPGILNDNGFILLEKSDKEEINCINNCFFLEQKRNYGDIELLIYIKKKQA